MAIQGSIIAIATISPLFLSFLEAVFRKKNFVAFRKLKAFFVSQINVNKANFYSLQK
jgi:hypothetical protein